jgi:hypothetical protein
LFYNIYNVIATFFFISFHVCCHGQDITGILLDSITNQPIKHAHIFSSGHNGTGTITNESGEFQLYLQNQEQPTDTLIMSHVAYQQLKIPLTKLPPEHKHYKRFYLAPYVIQLKEVTILDYNVMEIVHAIKKQLRQSKIEYGKAFYRQVSFRDTEATEWIESFYDLSYSPNGVDKLKINQARFARRRNDAAQVFFTHSNFSYVSLGQQLFSPKSQIDESRIGKPFGEDFTSNYDFFVNRTYNKASDIYYDIHFEPNTDSYTSPNVYGNFIYNYSKNRLIHYTARVDHALGANQIYGYSGDKTIEMKNPKYTFQFSFSENEGRLQLITAEFIYDLIQDGKVFPSKVCSKLLFYERVKKPHRKLREPNRELEDVSLFETAKYRPKFWRDHPVIKRTKEENRVITTFEKNNAFGTYFK